MTAAVNGREKTAIRRGPGRPKIVEAPSRPILPLTSAEIAAIAPLTKDGAPDLYNFMPSRLLPLDEARQRNFPLFYDGRACRYGHQAPRYVSNVNSCVDCHRISRGKQPIAGRSATLAVETPHKYDRKPETMQGIAAPQKPLEPDSFEKRFLVEYAAVKDLDRAAKLVGSTAAQIHMRLSTSAVFRTATNDLETRLNIRPTVPDTQVFEWDEDKRTRLITVYVDSGDMATARDAVRVTPSEFYKEIAANPQFAARLDEARPLALNSLEERAHQLALAGNDKMLNSVLKAEKPEKYSERVNVNMNVTERLTDEQLDNRLRRLAVAAQRRGQLIVDAEYVESPRETRAIADSRGSGPQSEPESNSDLL